MEPAHSKPQKKHDMQARINKRMVAKVDKYAASLLYGEARAERKRSTAAMRVDLLREKSEALMQTDGARVQIHHAA